MVDDRSAHASRTDLGDAGSQPTGIRSDRRYDLRRTLSNGRIGSSQPGFCNIEIAIRSKCESTGIVETGGENGNLV